MNTRFCHVRDVDTQRSRRLLFVGMRVGCYSELCSIAIHPPLRSEHYRTGSADIVCLFCLVLANILEQGCTSTAAGMLVGVVIDE